MMSYNSDQNRLVLKTMTSEHLIHALNPLPRVAWQRNEHEKVCTKERDMGTEQDCVGWFGYDTGLRLWFVTNKGDDGAIPLYKRRRNT